MTTLLLDNIIPRLKNRIWLNVDFVLFKLIFFQILLRKISHRQAIDYEIASTIIILLQRKRLADWASHPRANYILFWK